MPEIFSGQRVARSYLTPTGAEVASVELDFQLGARQGIQVEAVVGYGSLADVSPTVSDTVLVHQRGSQSLHLETGTLEGVPEAPGEDEVDIDTEIFYVQHFSHVAQVWSTVTGGGSSSMLAVPSSIVVFPEPIRTARNISHRAETLATGVSFFAGVLIYYHYLRFSNEELGFFLARRQ